MEEEKEEEEEEEEDGRVHGTITKTVTFPPSSYFYTPAHDRYNVVSNFCFFI
jgi:hypothetical protein